MKHDIEKVYSDSNGSWKVRCSCGWIEGGITRGQVLQRHASHQNMPHKAVSQ